MADYDQEIEQAIEDKLLELDGVAYGGATGRRFELAGHNDDGTIKTQAQHREIRRLVMRDIAQRLGLHFFQLADAVMIDQLITVSIIQGHDTAGLLKSLINSFLITYTDPATTAQAYSHLQGLEYHRARLEKGVGSPKH
ncbi:hypothetical protein NPS53_09255 [Pseudomonas putida]|uniref:hypothetical protein n=1 Tax=Pseudomonas putida TaxID=303 RepID=UPI0023634863|nr:hypothetical protein [Pseudomonas putida]MDD2139763.1 hypothetical protein [Pseudomonas putida]HDS1721687.1 hypothetical protein [Pseudomonas putida]